MFKKINIVPRWLIFCLDLTCCSFALILAYFLNNNFQISSTSPTSFTPDNPQVTFRRKDNIFTYNLTADLTLSTN